MLDIQYIKDNLDNTSIARQILCVDNLQLNFPPRYAVASKITYVDDSFKPQSISASSSSSVVIPMIDVNLNSSSNLDVIDYFKTTEELMLSSILNSFTHRKIPTMSLVESLDYIKKQIYGQDMKPKSVLVSKTVFDLLLNKLYLLEYSKVFTIPTDHISYDNLNIFPIKTKNDNLIIAFAEPYNVGMVVVRSKPYLSNNVVSQCIGMMVQNENAMSLCYVNKKDMNVILSNTGGYCKKCHMYDEYSPIDDDGKCICYKCYQPS